MVFVRKIDWERTWERLRIDANNVIDDLEIEGIAPLVIVGESNTPSMNILIPYAPFESEPLGEMVIGEVNREIQRVEEIAQNYGFHKYSTKLRGNRGFKLFRNGVNIHFIYQPRVLLEGCLA
ncbi:hypothetical protein HOD75_02150 [archaeon]|jgi:hypothetical protein|nr:hypothetical protein [archaeon]MBT4241679.1 hypothetical protein [archaeon]MBT4418074.1 hypothetical protein [archaeon]